MDFDVVDFDVLQGLLDWGKIVGFASVAGLVLGLLFSLL